MMSDSVTKIATALNQAKAVFKPAIKDASNPHFGSKFVSLQGVFDAVDEALRLHEIVVLQPTRIEDGRTVLVTTLLHSSGEWIAGEYPVAGGNGTPQAEGSGLTYARRYALMALLGIAPEDDDGNAAQAGQPTQGPARQAARPAAETPTQPAGPESVASLRSRINALGKTKRLSTAEISDDFATWSTGTRISEADAATLVKYLDYLNTTP